MNTNTDTKDIRINTLMTGRIGAVLEGFYCGFTPASVAHYILYMELRRGRDSRTKVMELPYFQTWSALRKRKMDEEEINLMVYPSLGELETQTLSEINGAVIVNRMDAAKTETLAGMRALVECVETKRLDGWEFNLFFEAVVLEAERLMDHIGITVARGKMGVHGKFYVLTHPSFAVEGEAK
ncbi:hypothetical protein [Erwinia phage vB_Ea277G]|nr:hypothetical protein [Erwinia phage vB_Ea277G]